MQRHCSDGISRYDRRSNLFQSYGFLSSERHSRRNGSILIDYISHPTQIELRLREGSRDPINGGIKEILPYSPVNNNMIYEIKIFFHLLKTMESSTNYLQYSLDTIRIIDHVLASHTAH